MTEIDYRTLADEKADIFLNNNGLHDAPNYEVLKQIYKIAYVEGHLDRVDKQLEKINETITLSQL